MSVVTVDELRENPHSALARLRKSRPVAWLPDLGGWIVTDRDLCIEVLTDAHTFTVDDERFSTRQVVGPSMLSLDGAEHRRHRKPFAPAFRERAVRELLETWTAETARTLVAEIADDGVGDLRRAVAAPLSTLVMSRVLGLEDVGVTELLDWNDRITSAIDEVTVGEPIPDYGKEAFGLLTKAVERSMAAGGLLSQVEEEGTLTVNEVAADVAVLLIGGIVTSDGTISIALGHLLDHPESLDAVLADPVLIDKAVEESMRLEPAAAFLDRYATREVALGPASIGQGELVRASISAANRDPESFEDPDRYDVWRSNAEDHIAFARGPHACLGFHVARLEARAAVRAVLEGLPGLAAAGPPIQASGLIFRSPETVPAVWTGDSGLLS